jgi:hypothetical protein
MTTHYFNVETTGIVGTGVTGRGIARIARTIARNRPSDTFVKLAAKGKRHDGSAHNPTSPASR